MRGVRKKMTASELRYLAAINDLDDQGKGARMAAMSQKLNVSKVSVYRAIERLSASGYVGERQTGFTYR